jgi:hypothetical protein
VGWVAIDAMDCQTTIAKAIMVKEAKDKYDRSRHALPPADLCKDTGIAITPVQPN